MGDERANMVRRYMPLARRLARRYQRRSEPLEDLEQVASIGLLKAVDRFDPNRDVAFSTFAVPTILGELRRHFRDRTWSVRVPRELQELSLRVDRELARLSNDLGRSPTIGELARALEVPDERVVEALEVAGAYRAASLDAAIADSLGTDEPGFDNAESRATLEPLLAHLGTREREVLRLRFAEDLTQAEIGERLGISQMHVSRLIRSALARLREAAGET